MASKVKRFRENFGVHLKGHVDLLTMAKSTDAWDPRKTTASLGDLASLHLNGYLERVCGLYHVGALSLTWTFIRSHLDTSILART